MPVPATARVYLERAQGGLDRLSQILTRMAEAARLEQSLDDAERERDRRRRDWFAAASRAIAARTPPREFILDAPDAPVAIDGAPDLIAQMLDKLVENAVEFGVPGRPVVVRVEAAGETALLSVSNDGPLLPETMRERLFESMVSVRADAQRDGGDAASRARAVHRPAHRAVARGRRACGQPRRRQRGRGHGDVAGCLG